MREEGKIHFTIKKEILEISKNKAAPMANGSFRMWRYEQPGKFGSVTHEAIARNLVSVIREEEFIDGNLEDWNDEA